MDCEKSPQSEETGPPLRRYLKERLVGLVIGLCWALFLCSFVIGRLLFPGTRLPTLLGGTLELILLRKIELYSLALATFAMIVFGLRSLRKGALPIKPLLQFTIGFGTAVLMLGICVFGAFSFQKITSRLTYPPKKLGQLRKDLAFKKMSSQKKVDVEIRLAQMEYILHGERSLYSDEGGKPRIFKPTKHEEGLHKAVHSLKGASLELFRIAYIWGIILILAFLLGFLTPVRRLSTFPEKREERSWYD